MNALTKIWQMPRSEATSELRKIFRVDVNKPREDRELIWVVRVTYKMTEDVAIEAKSKEEALELAEDEVPGKVLDTRII